MKGEYRRRFAVRDVHLTLRALGGEKYAALADEFGVTTSGITDIVRRTLKRYCPEEYAQLPDLPPTDKHRWMCSRHFIFAEKLVHHL